MCPQGKEGDVQSIEWFGYRTIHVSTLVSNHWSSEILKLDDKLTCSSEHKRTTDKEQKQTTPSEADKATRQVRAGPPLFCYWAVSVSVCVCICICLFDCAYVYMPPVPPPTPSWLRVSVLKRGWGEEWNAAPSSLSSPPILLVLRQNTHICWWYQSICCRKKESYVSIEPGGEWM